MKNLSKILAATLTAAVLALSAGAALADGRGHERGWGKHHHQRYYEGHKHHHHRGPVVYAPHYAPAPVYYAPPPPLVYQPNYYVPRPAPALTIGISPIVIPLR